MNMTLNFESVPITGSKLAKTGTCAYPLPPPPKFFDKILKGTKNTKWFYPGIGKQNRGH